MGYQVRTLGISSPVRWCRVIGRANDTGLQRSLSNSLVSSDPMKQPSQPDCLFRVANCTLNRICHRKAVGSKSMRSDCVTSRQCGVQVCIMLRIVQYQESIRDTLRQVKEDEVGRACSTNWGRSGTYVGYWWESQEERDYTKTKTVDV
jgi:hypothetical protein